MATTIDDSADRSNGALERLAASAERAERASEANAVATAQAAVVTKKLADEEKTATEAAARFKAKMDTATGAAGSLVDAFVTYNKEVYKGSSANEAAAASMHKMGEAAKYAGAFLAILVPGGPVVKALVASLGLLAAKAAEAGAELALQTDAVYKSYQDLAKAGATGKGGMQDVFNSLQKVGLGTQKFGEYLKLVNDNSQDLALFSGTVLKGRKIFEATMGSLTDQQKEQMELMGLNDTARAEATMNYIKQQRLLTMGTREQMNTSSTAVMKYIDETDKLARITGINRKEQEKAVEEAMRRQQFAATIDQLLAEGRIDEAAQLKQGLILAKAAGKTVENAYLDSAGGFVGSSEAAAKGAMATNFEMQNFIDTLKSGKVSTEEIMAGFGKVGKAAGDVYNGVGRIQAQMGNMESFGLSIEDTRRLIQFSTNDMAKAFREAGIDSKESADELAKAQAKTAIDTQATQLELQRKLNELMPGYVRELENTAEKNRALVVATGKLADDILDKLSPAFKQLFEALGPMVTKIGELMKDHVLPALVRAIESLAKFITKVTGGIFNVMNADGTDAKVKASGKAELGETVGEIGGAYAGMKGGAALGTGIGTALMPGVGTAVGAVGGGIVGALAGYFGGGALGRAADASAQDKSGMQQLAAMFGRKNEAEVEISERDKAFLEKHKAGIGTRAAGGPVSAKTPYLVGEEGPELFVPSLAGDIVPTGQLQGTTGSALKQSAAIEKIVDQIVLDIKSRQKISDIDADRAKDHSEEQKTQTAKINKSINDIVVSSKELDSISKIDLKRAQDYSIFYKGFIETKTKFEKDQLEAINYQLTEGSSGSQPGSAGSSGSGLKLPSMPGISGMGGGQGLQTTKQDDLSKMGLNIKTGDVQAEGAGISPRLIELARQIQGGVPGFNYFSAFNDKFHQEKAPSSQHAKGLALDFTVAQQPSKEEGKAITDWLKGLGASLAIDEYNNPSSKSTAGHFHAQIPGFEEGGMLGAGKVGIAGEGGKPELISGPASITPMNDLMGALNNLNAVMERSHSTLSEIARISKATSDSSAKMLSYAQN
jgi:hypothetical protein